MKKNIRKNRGFAAVRFVCGGACKPRGQRTGSEVVQTTSILSNFYLVKVSTSKGGVKKLPKILSTWFVHGPDNATQYVTQTKKSNNQTFRNCHLERKIHFFGNVLCYKTFLSFIKTFWDPMLTKLNTRWH